MKTTWWTSGGSVYPQQAFILFSQNKAHLPFDYSLTETKGRCECANFGIAQSVRWITSYSLAISSTAYSGKFTSRSSFLKSAIEERTAILTVNPENATANLITQQQISVLQRTFTRFFAVCSPCCLCYSASSSAWKPTINLFSRNVQKYGKVYILSSCPILFFENLIPYLISG